MNEAVRSWIEHLEADAKFEDEAAERGRLLMQHTVPPDPDFWEADIALHEARARATRALIKVVKLEHGKSE
jgi:hypothetical protein